MLLCHWSAEFVRGACDFSRGANVSRKDRQDSRDVAERKVSAPGETGTDQHRGVRNAIGDFIVKFANFRCATGSKRHHSVEHVCNEPQLDSRDGDDPLDPMIAD
jgi:hypothetical protein